MSQAFKTVGKVAGVVASVAAFIPGGQPIAAIAAAVAVVANVGAAITAPRPRIQGSSTSITIGADQPAPYMIGDTYYGGAMNHKTGYGGKVDKVSNPYLAMAVIMSVAGPIAGIDQTLADFEPLVFTGDEATPGYFNDILFRKISTGPLLQSTALTGPFGAIPGWGPAAKLSGKAHLLYSLKWDAKNGKYQSGAPQLGIRGRGVLTWDPRADSTYPGGSGVQRWASPGNRAGHDAAKATWTYTNRPGLHALKYALGSWERDLNSASSDHVLVFGIGMPLDGVVVEDFVALENTCEANGWTCNGLLYEPAESKWENLRRITLAGGAEPCWKGGRLGLSLTAPRLALDTIQHDDLADGDLRGTAMVPWRERINTAIPQYRSAAHKWEMQAASEVSVAAFVTADGERKPKEWPLELVTDPDQAAELALYAVYNAREQAPIVLPIGPRLRRYRAGDRLQLSARVRDQLGLLTDQVVILERSFDPGSMTGTLTLASETMAKHVAVLGTVAGTPPPLTLPNTAEYDQAQSYAALLPTRGAYQVVATTIGGAAQRPITSSDTTISIAAHDVVLEDGRRSGVDFGTFPAGTITGLTPGTQYGVFWSFTASAYEVEAFPAASRLSDPTYIYYWTQETSAGGEYSPTPTNPGGYRGKDGLDTGA